MVEIVFTKDFANRKKDDKMKIGSMIASRLIHKSKVAKLVTAKKTNTKSKK